MTGTAIEFRGVEFGYGQEPVLRGLDLRAPNGQITALLGPNGSGKTTILKLVLGLRRPQSGAVMVFGEDRSTLSPRLMGRKAGLVPQVERIPFDLALEEYVVLGRAPYLHLLQVPGDEDRRIARQAIADVGLEGLVGRSVLSFSGGELQLAAVARALAQQPRMLLLDEPTSHLDLRNRRRVLEVLQRQVEAGRTVLMTTHDPNAAASVAGHVILLRAGRVTASGTPDEVLTAGQLSAAFDVDIEVEVIRGRPTVLP